MIVRPPLTVAALAGREHDIRTTATATRRAARDARAAQFFGAADVRKALAGVGAEVSGQPWRASSPGVLHSVGARWLRYDGVGAVAQLLESGVRVLVYSAEAEFDANWVGTLAWLRALRWSGRDAFLAAEERMALDFPGRLREAAGLTYAKILGAGGLTPASLQLLRSWVSTGPAAT